MPTKNENLIPNEIDMSRKPRAITKKALKVLRSIGFQHYVYILHRPNGEAFYVGKGQNHRIFEHENEAKNTLNRSHKLNVIRSIQRVEEEILYSIQAAFENHDEATLEEIRLIKKIGRYDQGEGPLTNQTDGGEGTLNPSEESKEKHRQTLYGQDADDPERASVNKFFSEICSVKSTPIKPISKYGRSVGILHKNREYIGKRPRNAGALVAMAVAQGVIIKPGIEITRRFSFEKIGLILENGCGRDMMVNGMIELSDKTPMHETLRITEAGINYILENYSQRELISFGILE